MMPGYVLAIAVGGAILALAGGYWDDAWHTERGRDDFLIAPHIAIYGGVMLVGGALAAAILRSARRHGITGALRVPTIALATTSVAVTLASGPIDNAWHEAFGRDAVIWSPPHMLGIVGTICLGAAILAETHGRHRRLHVVTAALVLAGANFVVVEYDTDVPQFDELWYLPVLAVSVAVAFAMIGATASRSWVRSEAAGLHLVFVLVLTAGLLVLDFDGPALPLLLAPALTLDVAEQRHWPPWAAALAATASLYLAYVPVRNLLGSGVELDAADLPGAVLAFAGVWTVLAVTKPRRVVSAVVQGYAAATVLAGVLLLATPSALAHDPGQGEAAGSARLSVVSADGRAHIRGRLNRARCTEMKGDVVARRGGESLRRPLAVAGCSFEGTVPLRGRGRWFVYADLGLNGKRVEAWLPVRADGAVAAARPHDRYAYEPSSSADSAGKYAAGVLLYGVVVALVIATFRFLHRTTGTRSRA
jgi:hypothetical protein